MSKLWGITVNKNLFDKLTEGADLSVEFDSEKEIRWEENTVKLVLKSFGLQKVAPRIAKLNEEMTGYPNVTAAAFHEMFPDFPIYFGTAYITGLHANPKCMMPQLMNNFSNTPVIGLFEEFLKEVPEDQRERCLGLVFPRRGYTRGMIIHTGHGFWRRNVLRLVYDYGTPKKKERLVLEPFQSLIAWMGKQKKWQPD